MPIRTDQLVRPLFDGPLDVVGDIHGEIDALLGLLKLLGYSSEGVHAGGRRLVFLGDLTDRGPDSPTVVRTVRRLVDRGLAQCVLGNHDFNLLHGDEKPENGWFFGKHDNPKAPQVLTDETTRSEVLALFRTLPLALERPDLRVVHACWSSVMIERARYASDLLELYAHSCSEIDAALARQSLDAVDAGLRRQNENPLKVLTSGLEERIDKPFVAGGKTRWERRVEWWHDYADEPFCVFGHYSYRQTAEQPVQRGRNALCLDFGVGKRWEERSDPAFDGRHTRRLAALRWPEEVIVFDDGERLPLQQCRVPK